MRVRHRLQYAQEKLDSRTEREALPLAVDVQRLPLDVLEHEIGLRAVEHAGVEQARDIGLVQTREHPAFLLEALLAGLADPARMHELDRHRSVVATVGPARTPHAAHASATDLAVDDIRPDVPSGQRRGGKYFCGCRRHSLQETGKAVARVRLE